MQTTRTMEQGRGGRLARELGWFGLGVGLAELLTPRLTARLTGARYRTTRNALFGLGVLGIAGGAGMLAGRRPWRLARRLGRGRAIDVTRSIVVNRPRDAVYAYFRDFENLPRFMFHLTSVEVHDGTSRWRARGPAGTEFEWEAEVVDDRPNERIVWRSLPGAAVPNGGTVEFEPAPGGRGTVVRVELHYEPPAGVVGAAFAKLFGEEPGQQVAGDLRRFKQMLEIGEVLQSDASIHRGLHPARAPRFGAASPHGLERPVTS